MSVKLKEINSDGSNWFMRYTEWVNEMWLRC